jgi:hypothetical protein
MKNKSTLSSAKTTTFDAAAKTYIDTRLSGLSIVKAATGTIETIQPKSIDVGPGASNLNANTTLANWTKISKSNAANATGTLSSFEIWLYSNAGGTDTWFGSFYNTSGTTFYCRDSESVGDVTSGSKQTFSSVSVSVTTGDYLGVCAKGDTAIKVEATSGSGDGEWYYNGEKIDAGDNGSFTSAAPYQISIYATGTEAATDQPYFRYYPHILAH